MSSGYWQTKRQSEQYSTGNTITQRASDYVLTWKTRCYSDDIPDEIPAKAMRSNRAPSYKAIALAILRNDHCLHSIGFAERESRIVNELLEIKRNMKTAEDSQYDLFAA